MKNRENLAPVSPQPQALRPVRQTYTIAEVAEILGIGLNSAYGAARTGRIPCLRLSPRRLVVARQVIADLLTSYRRTETAGGPEAQ